MTGAELYTLNTEIRGGRVMDETTFYILLNLAKSTYERRRAWRKLIKKDSSLSASPSTTNATQLTIPTDLIMTLPRRTLKLVNTDGYLDYTEVPFERWEEYKNSSGYFTLDHLSGKFYLSGTVSSTYTIHFYYIATSTTLASGASWVFPAEFHPALAFEVAGRDELGMDYDEINARQGNANLMMAETIMRGAIKWDDSLARGAMGI